MTSCPHCKRPLDDAVLSIGDLEMNLSDDVVTRSGKFVSLTKTERELLRFLLRNKGKTFTRTAIVNEVWGKQFDGLTNIVDVYVNYLRNKIGFGVLHTVRGIGYRLGEAA